MLKAIFENKGDGGKLKKTVAEIAGQEVDRDHLLRMKHELTERMARQTDPVKNEEDAILLAQVNNLLDAFERVDQARGQAAARKRQIDEEQRQVDLAEAAKGQEVFLGYLDDILWPALEKLIELTPSHGRCAAGTPREILIRKCVEDYRRQLFQSLSYSDAEKQAKEINAAAREGRPWKLLVHLPMPKNNYLENLTRVVLHARRPGEVVPGTGIRGSVRGIEDPNYV